MRLAPVIAIVVGAQLVACGSDGAEPPTVGIAIAPPTATVERPGGDANDLADSFRAFVNALNNGSAGEAKAMLSPDVSWERGGQCPPGQCAGRARVGQEVDRDVANHHRLEIASLQIDGDTVTASIELSNDGTRQAGVERIIQVFTVRFVDGMIVALRAVNDLTDPVTAAFAGRRGGQ